MSVVLPFGAYTAEARVVKRPGGAEIFVRVDRYEDGEWVTQALIPIDHVSQIIAALHHGQRKASELWLSQREEA